MFVYVFMFVLLTLYKEESYLDKKLCYRRRTARVNCCTPQDNKSTTNRSNGVRLLRLIHRRVVNSHDASTVVGVETPEFGTKFHGEVPLFLETPKFQYNTGWDKWKEASTPKPARRFDTTPACDGQTGTRRRQIPR